MDYDQARGIGDAGEMKVAAELSRLQSACRFVMLHDVLIGTAGAKITAQLDHVVIDEMGVLIIETKVRNDAWLYGTYADSKWTACYPSKKKVQFQNPLRQNEQHISLLHQLLKATDPSMSIERVRGWVVFIGADISHLELDSVNEQRVLVVQDLESRFGDRRAFMIQPPLSEEAQVALASRVAQLDRSEDSSFTQAHAAYRNPSPAASVSPPPVAPAPNRSFATRPVPSPVIAPKDFPLRTLVVAATVVAALVFIAWAVFAVWRGTVPPWVYVVFFIILAAFGGETRSRGRRGSRGSSRSAPEPRSFGERLVALALTLALMVAFGFGTIWYLQRALRLPGSPTTGPASPATAPAPAVTAAPPYAVTADVAQAKRALKDAEPRIYAALVQPDQPKTVVDGNRVSYEWEYLERSSQATVRVKRIKITLDAAGRIVGVTSP